MFTKNELSAAIVAINNERCKRVIQCVKAGRNGSEDSTVKALDSMSNKLYSLLMDINLREISNDKE